MYEITLGITALDCGPYLRIELFIQVLTLPFCAINYSEVPPL